MKKAKFKSRADFIMALLRDVRIIVPEGLREMAVELKKEGNNFNQTVRLWNKTQSATPPAVFTMAYRYINILTLTLTMSVTCSIAIILTCPTGTAGNCRRKCCGIQYVRGAGKSGPE